MTLLTARKTFTAATLLVALLQGCAQVEAPRSQAAALPGLQDSAWTMGAPTDTATPQAEAPTLRFEGGRVFGSDGCNRYSAPYTAAKGKLEIGPGRIGTQMACPTEDGAQLARVFNQVLDEVRAYRIEGAGLLLLDARGDVLARFTAQPTTLAGTAWRISGINNGKQAVVGVIAGTEPTLQFTADGRLQGSGGCNRFNGSFSAQGKSLRIDRLASTRMACTEPAGRMAQESQLLAALESVATAQREGDRLELRTSSGALAVSARLAMPPRP